MIADDTRTELIADIGRGAGVPARYYGHRLDMFGDNPRIVGSLSQWVASSPMQSGRGLYVHGPLGRGKTALMSGALHHLVDCMVAPVAKGLVACPQPMFTSVYDLFASLDVGWRFADDRMFGYCTVPVLAIDDLGVYRMGEWEARRMIQIVTSRYSSERPTLVTSPYSLEELGERINEQTDGAMGRIIVGRLQLGCEVIAFSNDDPNWRRM